MYKTTSDNQNYLGRTGSHATKPQSNGDTGLDHGAEFVNDIDLVSSRADLLRQKSELIGECQEISKRLLLTLPHDEYQRLASRRVILGSRLKIVDESLGRQKASLERIRRLNNQALGEALIEVARHRLSPGVFHQLLNEAKQFRDTANDIQPADRRRSDGSDYDMGNPGGASAKARRKIASIQKKGQRNAGLIK